MIRSTLFALMALMALAPGRAMSADDGGPWTALSADESFSAWRKGEHKGWSIVANAVLNHDNEKKLSAADLAAGSDAPKTLLSGGDSDLYTKDEFQDVEVKFEFMIPKGSNSGVKLNGLYEIQIRDTQDDKKLTGDSCGGVYPRAEAKPKYHHTDEGVPPRTNAAKAPGEWQTLEIAFTAPRFDAEGKKTTDARFVRVVLNGETIHEDADLKWPTGAAWDEAKEIPRGPFQLQGDHGSVAFRNLQIRPLAAH
jgi:hypothetical protein